MTTTLSYDFVDRNDYFATYIFKYRSLGKRSLQTSLPDLTFLVISCVEVSAHHSAHA